MTNQTTNEACSKQEIQSLSEKLNHLEMTQAYQEDSIESLEKTVGLQHQEIQSLKQQLRLLSDFLKTMRQDSIKSPEDEAPPPHY